MPFTNLQTYEDLGGRQFSDGSADSSDDDHSSTGTSSSCDDDDIDIDDNDLEDQGFRDEDDHGFQDEPKQGYGHEVLGFKPRKRLIRFGRRFGRNPTQLNHIDIPSEKHKVRNRFKILLLLVALALALAGGLHFRRRQNSTDTTLSDREQALLQREKEIAEREKAAADEAEAIANQHKAAEAREKLVAEREKAAEQKEQEQQTQEQPNQQQQQETVENEPVMEDVLIEPTKEQPQQQDTPVEEDTSPVEEPEEENKEEAIFEEELAVIEEINGGDEDNADEEYQQQLDDWENAAWDRMSSTQKRQVNHYRDGDALLLDINIPHQGTYAMCAQIGKAVGPVPSYMCHHDHENVFPDPPNCDQNDPYCYSFHEMVSTQMPWLAEQTDPFIDAIHPYFHMITWSLKYPVGREEHDKGRTLESPTWNNPRLVSAVVIRDPLSRLLAGDGVLLNEYPGYNTGELSLERWWDYAAYDDNRNTDNLFLRIMSTTHRRSRDDEQKAVRNHIEEGTSRGVQEMLDLFPTGISEEQFKRAKKQLSKFTFVLDEECLVESMDLVSKMLHLDPIPHQWLPPHESTESPRDRIPDDVYEYLVMKNEWDIRLYEYAKTLSVVQCPSDEVFFVPESEEITEAPTYAPNHDTNPPTNMTPPPTSFDHNTNPPTNM